MENEGRKTVQQYLMERFLAEREGRGWKFSQSDFARLCNVPQSSMSRWMVGGENPSYEMALNIAVALKDVGIFRAMGYPEEEVEKQVMIVNWNYMTPAQRRIVLDQVEQVMTDESGDSSTGLPVRSHASGPA